MSGLTSESARPSFLIEGRGRTRHVEAQVTGCIFDRSGAAAGFATGEGVLWRADRDGSDWTAVLRIDHA